MTINFPGCGNYSLKTFQTRKYGYASRQSAGRSLTSSSLLLRSREPTNRSPDVILLSDSQICYFLASPTEVPSISDTCGIGPWDTCRGKACCTFLNNPPEELVSHGSSCNPSQVPCCLTHSLQATLIHGIFESKKMIGPWNQGLEDRIHQVTLNVKSRHAGFLQLPSCALNAGIYGPIRADETDTAVRRDVVLEISQRERHGTEMQASVVHQSIY